MDVYLIFHFNVIWKCFPCFLVSSDFRWLINSLLHTNAYQFAYLNQNSHKPKHKQLYIHTCLFSMCVHRATTTPRLLYCYRLNQITISLCKNIRRSVVGSGRTHWLIKHKYMCTKPIQSFGKIFHVHV